MCEGLYITISRAQRVLLMTIILILLRYYQICHIFE